MIRARRRAIYLTAILGLLAAAILAISGSRSWQRPNPAPARNDRPTLLLLTTLPLLFSEDFSLAGGGSPALEQLERRYRVVPISVTDPHELARGRILLMAQPLAQTAENLVALDDWVRAGGRLMLLADPLLEWPSKRPLGDVTRPPPSFADTGLLAHWGLRLDAPDDRGPRLRRLGGREIQTVSPGAVFGRCAVSGDRLVARCRLGKGEAIVVADADFLNVSAIEGPGDANLPALLAALADLDPGGSAESR